MNKNIHPNLIRCVHGVTTALFILLIVTLLIFTLANKDLNQSDDVAQLMGLGFLSAESSEASGLYNQGDVIFINLIDEGSLTTQINQGTYVTYYDEHAHQFVTGYVEMIYEDHGSTYVETNLSVGSLESQVITMDQIIGTYHAKVIGFGSMLDYLQTPKGFAVFILMPVLTLLMFEITILIKNMDHYQQVRFQASFKKKYQHAIKKLEVQTKKIKDKILSNWLS